MIENIENRENKLEFIAKEYEKQIYGLKLGKKLVLGGYGLVVEASYKNSQKMAAKLFKKLENDETKLALEFKSQNIININKIFYGEKDEINSDYKLVLMEYADLKDLKTWIKDLYENNKLKLIVSSPFEEEVSDNVIRYFSYEIIKGLESLDRKDYCHFDIKPDNILIFKYLIPKITDFSLLRNPEMIKNDDNDGTVSLVGGTPGYLSPEYYCSNFVSMDVAKKQDYFALGVTIFQLKYGYMMIPPKKFKQDIVTTNYIFDLIQRAINLIKSKKLSDNDFINFLINLINYNPEDRPKFEEIYRNKWVNKNLDKISKCYNINFLDEEKLFMELNKSDFLIHKKNKLKKNRKKFIF